MGRSPSLESRASAATAADCSKVIEFLGCRTPGTWVDLAVRRQDLLLLDHAALELKAAEQAQKLIRRYGLGGPGAALEDETRLRLVARLSRLAREELRHFEQVVALIEARGGRFAGLSPSRYARQLHALSRRHEPGALVDSLIIGAVIEARSCERFLCLVEASARLDPALAALYAALLRSEARHFENYLTLARRVTDPAALAARVAVFLDQDRDLVESEDAEFRFHSGRPSACRVAV